MSSGQLSQLLTLAVLVSLLGAVNPVLATTIDFESFSDSTPVTTQIPGLIFADATVLTASVTLNAFEFPPHSGTHIVFDDGGPMTIEFTTPQPSIGGFFTYAVPLTVEAFDASHNSLGSITSAFSNNEALSGNPGSSPNELLSITASAIAAVTITGDPGGGSFALDDLTFSSAALPEPSPLAMMVSVMAMLFCAILVRNGVIRRDISKPIRDISKLIKRW